MFCRSSTYIDTNLSLTVLKNRVCQVIEQEVQNEIAQHDLSEEEDYLEISEKFWSKFYSCCEQYQMAANQPIALFMLECSDVICIVKKQMISFLRPCDKFENFVLSGYCTEDLVPVSETKLRTDLEAIIKVLMLLERTISDDIRAEIDAKLHRLQMPNVIISDILRDQSMMNNSDEVFSHQFVTTLSQKMQGLHDIPATVIALLDFLRLDQHSEGGEGKCIHCKFVDEDK
jgi:nuclear pore complex protein Nup160